MYRLFLLLLLFPANLVGQELTMANSIHQFTAKTVDGKNFDFSCLEGQKILLVNTGSKCMYAQQLNKLQKLYENYQNKGFIVIAFPSRDFYNRELKNNEEIAQKYRTKYRITFPIMSLCNVKGDNIHPVFDFLSNKSLNGKFDAPPKWNFHKYLIDEDGFIIKAINPAVNPFSDEIINWLETN